MTKNRQMMKKPQIWEKGQNREKPGFRRKNGLDRVNPNLVHTSKKEQRMEKRTSGAVNKEVDSETDLKAPKKGKKATSRKPVEL